MVMMLGAQEISPEIIAGLKLRYPNVKSVDNELSLMALWLAKNPSRFPKRPIRFIENWLKKSTPKLAAVPKRIPAWWQSDAGTMQQAAILGLEARPGEDMHQFRERIRARMAA
jgi:hypothetical protein